MKPRNINNSLPLQPLVPDQVFAANQIVMKKKLPITKNKDVVVSWVYTWIKQQP